MSLSVSEINLKEDFEKLAGALEFSRWKLEHPAGLEILCLLTPKNAPTEIFQARLLWDVYPDNPPSLKFRESYDRDARYPDGVAVSSGIPTSKS